MDQQVIKGDPVTGVAGAVIESVVEFLNDVIEKGFKLVQEARASPGFGARWQDKDQQKSSLEQRVSACGHARCLSPYVHKRD
ncbi:MAG: hypothetical protein ACUVWO_14825 [Thermodesulfobacteriota bacterium]